MEQQVPVPVPPPVTEMAVIQEGSLGIQATITRAVVAGAPVDVMRGLFDLLKDIRADEARIAFAQAFTRLQAKLPRITKHGRILNRNGTVRSTYAPIDDIDIVIRPLLIEEGFSISYTAAWVSGVWTLTGTLLHAASHFTQSVYPVPMEKSEFRSGAQDTGAANMYAKRQCLCNLLNIITVDVDQDGQPSTDAEPITLQQCNQIRDLIIAAEVQEPRVCKAYDVQAIEEITKGQFDEVIAALKMKLRRK